MLCQIIVALLAWALLTVVALYTIQKFKSERASLIGGAVLIVSAVVVALLLPSLLGVQYPCNDSACYQRTHMATTLVTFYIISWGAIGANLISACVTHR